MAYFVYDNKSLNSIIDDELIILSNVEGVDVQTNLAKNIIKGEINTARHIANHIGTTYSEVATFDVFLCKKSALAFTETEQMKIINWITSYNVPKWFEIKDGSISLALYRGLFTNVQYQANAAGIFGMTLSFEADSPYDWSALKTHTFTFNNSAGYVSTINLESDYLDYDIYPIVEITGKTKNDYIKIQNFYGSNDSTEEPTVLNSMIVKTFTANLKTTFDCSKCTAKDSTGNIDYSYIGWDTATNIEWLRLKAGANNIGFYGNGVVTISYRIPQKKARIYF